MPQLDREPCAGGASGGGGSGSHISVKIPEAQSDFPPESFRLSKDEELEWFNYNALLVRKESTRGNSFVSTNNPNPNHGFNSARVSIRLKSKAHVLGLPKTRKASCVDPTRRSCRGANARLLPGDSMSMSMSRLLGKPVAMATEPTSPKVSCVGKVRPKQCNRRSNSRRSGISLENNNSTNPSRGFYSKLLTIFRSKKLGQKKQARSRSRRSVEEVATIDETPPNSGRRLKSPELQEPPGLGAVQRFSSCRRSESFYLR
ncbi:uncharacterized protein LOC127264748 [Andrographis paniculata]|uniref:uncharacterized protein LOC127264748 n=1 Tax=Andrographis paniculata TaxID=175694 RepID=UPI0021E7D835|nr:uncharacterized protein LOC127264748 [Andrographis paniculata]